MAVTAVAAGPVTISSRWDGPPAKIRWTSPECMPCDIRSVTLPAEVCSAPSERSRRRMPNAERLARSTWSGPSKSSSSASPPNFSRLPSLR